MSYDILYNIKDGKHQHRYMNLESEAHGTYTSINFNMFIQIINHSEANEFNEDVDSVTFFRISICI